MDPTLGLSRPPESARLESPDRDRVHYDSQDRIHYNAGGVLVTGTWLRADGRNYPIAELTNIRTVRGSFSDMTINLSLVVVALMITIARVWDQLNADGWLGALTILGFVVSLAVISSRVRRRTNFMIADHGRARVLLVEEDSSIRYGQIFRAVQRAREAHGL